MSSPQINETLPDARLKKHQAFWSREETDRPVWGVNIGFFANEVYPRTMAKLAPGRVESGRRSDRRIPQRL